MARLFDDASSQYLENAAAVLTAAPIAMACWFRSNDATVNQVLIDLQLSTASVNDHSFQLVAAGAIASDPIRAITTDTVARIAVTSTGYTANTWHHACGVFASATDRRAFIDGGSKGTNAISATPVGINTTSIGRRVNNALYMSGDIAEAAIWDVALTDDEVAILGKGFSPLFVRPASLVAYWPLLAYSSPELDRVGGFGMTVTGATKSDHPRIIYPSRARLILPAAAAAGGFRSRIAGGLVVSAP